MPREIDCILCREKTYYFYRFTEKDYYRCSGCRSIMMDPFDYLPAAEEKKRYDQHKNDVNDPGYREFARPLVEKVLQKFTPGAVGLDYGAGPGPVSAVLLQGRGFKIALYDPFYWNDREVLDEQYEFIICCEVIEHFYAPAREFKFLRSLLKPHGSLYCMTEIYSDDLDFERWYYKNDPTHVFFYHRQAFDWIRDECGFSKLSVDKRVIHFEL